MPIVAQLARNNNVFNDVNQFKINNTHDILQFPDVYEHYLLHLAGRFNSDQILM